jgi:4,5-dihydroxyphthalate decarboxylase
MQTVAVRLVTRNYDYVQPLAMGDVPSDGVDIALTRTFDALVRLGDASFDGGEMSLSRYLQALAGGDQSVLGLPIFPMRGFRHRCFFVHRDSRLEDIGDLAGKRVGINEWPATGNTWARAALRERGVDIRGMHWLVGQVSAGYKPVPDDPLPAGVERAPAHRLLVDLLAAGEIDAIVCPWPPAGFYDDPATPVRRLYPDFRAVERDYYRRTRLYPAHHIIVLKRAIVDRSPEVVGGVYRAFEAARRLTLQNHRALAETLPWLLAELEEDTALMGHDFQPYGLDEANAHMLAAFCDELVAQGLTPGRLDPRTAFAEFEELARLT